MVPGGSTNVFARALGLPGTTTRWEATGALLDALREGSERTVGLEHGVGYAGLGGRGGPGPLVHLQRRSRLRRRCGGPRRAAPRARQEVDARPLRPPGGVRQLLRRTAPPQRDDHPERAGEDPVTDLVSAISIIGPDKDIPALDVGTDSQVTAWIMNEYAKYHGFYPACVTGKPVEFHGSAGRCCHRVWRRHCHGEILARRKQTIPGTTPSPFKGDDGNVGSHTANFLHEQGGKSSPTPDAYRRKPNNLEGIDIKALNEHVAVHRKVVGFKGGDPSTNEHLLTMPVDVLIPAAPRGVFDAKMAQAVQAKMIVEAANGPTWPEADAIFHAA